MIAISSHRAFSESPEYALNASRASKTWRDKFRLIYYYGSYEEGLASDNVRYCRKHDEWPRIADMAAFASHENEDYVAIINADIVLNEEFQKVQYKLRLSGVPAATSYRYEFNPSLYPDLSGAVRHKEDRGMDIFIASPEQWKAIARIIPNYLRIGHGRWDSWLCGYFCHNLGYGFRQFTMDRCVFHPKHEGRGEPPHGKEIAAGVDDYFTRAKYPSPL